MWGRSMCLATWWSRSRFGLEAGCWWSMRAIHSRGWRSGFLTTVMRRDGSVFPTLTSPTPRCWTGSSRRSAWRSAWA